MSTISYPYLPAAAHQPDGEHLQFGDHYIHYGEPMRSAASEQGSIYTPMMTEPEQTRTGTDLEVYLQTRVLRCGCGFQMEIPDKNRSRDRQGQRAARPAQSRERPSVRRYWRPNTQTDRKERAGTLMRPAGDRRDPETRADITPHQPDRGDCHDNRREIMTGGAECVGENETLEQAARKMKDLDVGSLPICGEDNRLKGMLTDRDIVIKCLADGGDPRTATAGEFGQGKPVTIGADDSIEEAIRTMQEHQVRRLPVIDGHDLVGMLSQADIARNYPEDRVGELVEFISY